MTTLSPKLWSPHVCHTHLVTLGVLCVAQDILTLIWASFLFFSSHFYNSKEKESLKVGEEKESIPLED